MKRSEINQAIVSSLTFFEKNGWKLPPAPKWDVTDFGLGSFLSTGLVLVNLAEEPEYCEKLMYARKSQVTPAHTHHKKKEDIICRCGELVIQLWSGDPAKKTDSGRLEIKRNGIAVTIASGTEITLQAGERVTIEPRVWHKFYPASNECIIGEVSTANDDDNDNIFSDENIGRFAKIDEDEHAFVPLLSDK